MSLYVWTTPINDWGGWKIGREPYNYNITHTVINLKVWGDIKEYTFGPGIKTATNKIWNDEYNMWFMIWNDVYNISFMIFESMYIICDLLIWIDVGVALGGWAPWPTFHDPQRGWPRIYHFQSMYIISPPPTNYYPRWGLIWIDIYNIWFQIWIDVYNI